VLVQLNSFTPQVDKSKTRLGLARRRFNALSLLFKSSLPVDVAFAVPQAFSTLNFMTQILSDENTALADVESALLECLQSAQSLSISWRFRIDIQKPEFFDLVHFELQLSSLHRTNVRFVVLPHSLHIIIVSLISPFFFVFRMLDHSFRLLSNVCLPIHSRPAYPTFCYS
jgi:hypothetical protein